MHKLNLSALSPKSNDNTAHEPTLHSADEDTAFESSHDSVYDSMPDWVWEIDQYGFITYSNPRVNMLLDLSPEDIKDKSFLHLVPENDSGIAKTLLTQQWAAFENIEYVDHNFKAKDGSRVAFETTGLSFFDASNNCHGTRFFSRSAGTTQTAGKPSDQGAELAANNVNFAIAITDPDGIITYTNPALSELFGYSEAELMDQPLTILENDDNTSNAQLEDIALSLQTKKVWHGELIRKNKKGQYIPCMISLRAVEDENNTAVSHVVSYLDLRPVKQSSMKTQKSLKKIISTVCNAIEDRNVIKSQHQERVTDLAVAIAFEMGKDVKFIEGLTLACQLHDLGEMFIPPEIANRPGKLSESEFEMIRTHPKKGYEILKDIDLPWPIADIVLQHHERIDGSGYPNKLRGEEIMMEARILAVADLVETMLTDRPYRPACTVAVCVKELEENRGILFDSWVVDICLRLIRENNYFLKAF